MQSLVARSIIHFLTLPKRTLFTSELILFHHKIKQTIFIEIFIYGNVFTSSLQNWPHLGIYIHIYIPIYKILAAWWGTKGSQTCKTGLLLVRVTYTSKIADWLLVSRQIYVANRSRFIRDLITTHNFISIYFSRSCISISSASLFLTTSENSLNILDIADTIKSQSYIYILNLLF